MYLDFIEPKERYDKINNDLKSYIKIMIYNDCYKYV